MMVSFYPTLTQKDSLLLLDFPEHGSVNSAFLEQLQLKLKPGIHCLRMTCHV